MTYLPWLMSALTIYMTVLAGNKSRYAWAVGLLNQALWLTWIVSTSAWGFLPMNAALWAVYARNHLKWDKASQPPLAELNAAVKAAVELVPYLEPLNESLQVQKVALLLQLNAARAKGQP